MKTNQTESSPKATATKAKASGKPKTTSKAEPQKAPQNAPTAQPTCCCQKVKNFFSKLFGKKC